ncbi:MAG: DUF4493 domain-containing protein [Bacteroidales bacterium]
MVKNLTHIIILITLCFCTITSCDKETIRTDTVEGKGTLFFSYGAIAIDNNITTIGTKAAPLPSLSDFKMILTPSSNGTTYTGSATPGQYILLADSYTLELTYGTNYLKESNAPFSTTPSYYGSTNFTITAGGITDIRLGAKFCGSIITVVMPEDLIHHYKTYRIKVAGGEGTSAFETTVTPGAQLFLRPNIPVIITLEGTNLVNETKTVQLFSSASLTNGVIADHTEYTINCTSNYPIFSLPEQNDLNVWSYTALLSPLSASNISRGDAASLLSSITYKLINNEDQSELLGTPTDGKIKFTGLIPGKKYLYKAVYKGVESTNTYTFTTETAEQLMYGNMDTWSTGSSEGQTIYYPNATAENTYWATRNTQTMSEGTNAWYTRCPGTRQTSNAQRGSAASITTVGWGGGNTWAGFMWSAVINKISSGWLVYGDVSTSGQITKNRTINARPDKISFYYKYAPRENSQWQVVVEVIHNGTVIGSASYTPPNSTAVSSYTKMDLDIAYTNPNLKATNIYVFFTNKTSPDDAKKHIAKYDNPTRYEGALLYIDEIALSYLR